MSEATAAFAALDAIESGAWDRYLVQLQAAIRRRLRAAGYRAKMTAEPAAPGTPQIVRIDEHGEAWWQPLPGEAPYHAAGGEQ